MSPLDRDKRSAQSAEITHDTSFDFDSVTADDVSRHFGRRRAVSHVSMSRPSLDEVYLSITGRSFEKVDAAAATAGGAKR